MFSVFVRTIFSTQPNGKKYTKDTNETPKNTKKHVTVFILSGCNANKSNGKKKEVPTGENPAF